MSCFSAPQNDNNTQKTKLLEERLKKIISFYSQVRFPLIINEYGDIVCTLTNIEDIPADLGSLIVTARSLSERMLRILSSTNGKCRRMKNKGDNNIVFNLHCVDERHTLVYFSSTEDDNDALIGAGDAEVELEDLLDEIRSIISSEVHLV